VAVAFALLSSFFAAMASVLEQRVASSVPEQHSMQLGLLVRLLQRPLWLLGLVSDWTGYAFQAVALAFGSLVLVAPVLTTSVLFALPVAAHWAGRRLQPSDWIAAASLAVALAVFIVVGDPTAGVAQASGRGWLICGGIVGVLAGISVSIAMRRRRARRAPWLALATGLFYGVMVALTKSAVDLLGRGFGTVVTAWQLYALLACGLVTLLLNQSAYQAGDLEASLPILFTTEPVVASIIGAALLEERFRAHGWEWGLVGASVAVMLVAVVALARRAAVLEDQLSSSTASSPAA